MDEKLELLKLTEECGELVQISMKTHLYGVSNFHPKSRKTNLKRMIEEMGDVLCHLKRTANVLDISWNDIQARSAIKNEKVNKNYYGGRDVWKKENS